MKLSEPSKELAAKVLGKVGFHERLVGVRMTPMAGALQQPIHGFQEATNFLHIDSLDHVLAAGPRASVAYIDPTALKRWVGEVFGDTELAEAMGEAIEKCNSYVETIRPVRQLMEQRLNQCKAVVKGEGAG
jgi:hypothetical protein